MSLVSKSGDPGFAVEDRETIVKLTGTDRFRTTYRSLLNARDEHGYTPLHLAVQHGNAYAITSFAQDRYALFVKDKAHKYPIAYTTTQESRFFIKESICLLYTSDAADE